MCQTAPMHGVFTVNKLSIVIYHHDNLHFSNYFLVYFKLYPESSWNKT